MSGMLFNVREFHKLSLYTTISRTFPRKEKEEIWYQDGNARKDVNVDCN